MTERQVSIGTTWLHACPVAGTCEAYYKTQDVTRPDGQPARRIVGSFCKCEPKEMKDGNESAL